MPCCEHALPANVLLLIEKGIPSAVSLSFNTLYFDGLAMRGTVVKGAKYYTITKFSSFDDILGCRWFIRG